MSAKDADKTQERLMNPFDVADAMGAFRSFLEHAGESEVLTGPKKEVPLGALAALLVQARERALDEVDINHPEEVLPAFDLLIIAWANTVFVQGIAGFSILMNQQWPELNVVPGERSLLVGFTEDAIKASAAFVVLYDCTARDEEMDIVTAVSLACEQMHGLVETGHVPNFTELGGLVGQVIDILHEGDEELIVVADRMLGQTVVSSL